MINKIMQSKIVTWIAKKRVLDGYTGIFGWITHYRILANYSVITTIFSLSSRLWKIPLFHFDLTYHNYQGRFPPLSFNISLWKWEFDSVAKEREELEEWSKKDMAEWRARKEEEQRLIEAAKEAGL